MNTEQKIQKQILDYLSSLPNTYAVKIISANRSGIPDILACHQGHFYAFEVKRQGGVIAPLQLHNQLLVQQAGGTSLIVDNLPIVQSIFQPISI